MKPNAGVPQNVRLSEVLGIGALELYGEIKLTDRRRDELRDRFAELLTTADCNQAVLWDKDLLVDIIEKSTL